MNLEINPKVKFDESLGYSFIPKEIFELFSTYFSFKSNQKYKSNKRFQGLREFKFNYNSISQFSDEELSQAACYIIPYSRAFENSEKTHEIIKKLKGRRVKAKDFIKYSKNINYSELNEFSSEMINNIAWELKSNDNFGLFHVSHQRFSTLKEEYNEYTKVLKNFNEEKEDPSYLEKIIDLDSTPIAMRFDDKGLLYVIDKKGVLHSFKGAEKVKEQKMPFDFPYVNSDYMGDFLEEGVTLLPNIFVKDNLLYLTTATAVQTFDLNETQEKGIELYKGGIQVGSNGRNLFYHDCIVKDDFVLMSFSDYTNRFIAAKTIDKEKLIFSKEFPRNKHAWGESHWGPEEFTLRMDVHRDVLYIPDDQGITMFDGKNTQDIIKAYNSGGDWLSGIFPTTKFSFGDKFLVAMLRVKGLNNMAIGLFEPQYKGKGLIKQGDVQVPDSFDLKYMMSMPRISSPTMKHGNVAAQGNQFVTSDTMFNQLNFYRMKE